MKTYFKKALRAMLLGAAVMMGAFGLTAQNSLPAPGSGGSFHPNPGPAPGMGMGPGPGLGINGIGWNPGPQVGTPWYTGWNTPPAIVINQPVTSGNIPNQGIMKVIACGYDAQGVWRVLPMLVSFQYNGVQYDVNVLNAWNPWTNQWDQGLDVEAFNTNYILRNITYDFYVVLPYGTFYFNL